MAEIWENLTNANQAQALEAQLGRNQPGVDPGPPPPEPDHGPDLGL